MSKLPEHLYCHHRMRSQAKKKTPINLPTKAFEWLTRRGISSETINAAREAVQKIDDPLFVADLDEIVNQEPLLAEHAKQSRQHLYIFLTGQVKTIANKVGARVEFIEKNTWDRHLTREFKMRKKEARTTFRIQLLEELNTIYVNENVCVRSFICIDTCLRPAYIVKYRRLTTVLEDVNAQRNYSRYGWSIFAITMSKLLA